MCPCNYGRLGAFTVAACIVWALQFGGVAAMVNLALAGNFIAIAWAVAAVFGGAWLCIGISEALSHDDGFNPASVIFSAAVIGLAAYAMRNGWYLRGDALLFHLSRAFWWGLVGSEVFAIWLQLRGRRRHAAPVCEPEPMRQQRPQFARSRFKREHVTRDSRTTEWLEETVSDDASLIAPRPVSHPDLIEHGGAAPQLVYLVQDRDGNFVPLPSDRVPVRRLR